MSRSLLSGALFTALVLSLTGCSSWGPDQEFRDYIEEHKRRPEGTIEPLPPFPTPETFAYSAMTLRSPFERPVPELPREAIDGREVVQPDPNRQRELLESFSITNLRMVGTMTVGGTLWALIDDGQGGVHSATVGNHMGRNHGRIVEATNTQIRVLEIISDGAGGWIERPRIITLEEKE